MDYPVWINADIIAGPLNNINTVPVEPVAFFNGAKQLPNCVLSIGWTTLWGPDFTEGIYNSIQIENMVNAIKVKIDSTKSSSFLLSIFFFLGKWNT